MKNKSYIIGLCLLLMTSTLASVASADSMFDDWGMVRHDAGNTGRSDSALPEYTTVQWTTESVTPSGDILTIADGYVYVTIGQGTDVKIVRYEAYTGEMDEDWFIGGHILNSITIVDGQLYFAKSNGKLYCFEADTLDLIWSYLLEDTTAGFSSAVVTDGKVLFTNRNTDRLYCLDAEGNGDGTTDLLWMTIDYNLDAEYQPAVVNGKVFTSDGSAYVYCFDLDSTGDEVAYLWRYHTSKTPRGIAVENNKVFVVGNRGTSEGYVYCLDANTGSAIWVSQLINPFRQSYPTVANGAVYVMDPTTLYCFDADATGTDVAATWTKDFAGAAYLYKIGPIYAGGQVFVASTESSSGIITAIDAENDHDILMEVEPGIGQVNTPLVIYDGYIYGTTNYKVFCIGGRNHDPMTPDQPIGPEEGLVDQEYSFILKNITDYDESDLTITIDWGEGEFETFGPLPSGIEEIPVSHTWETAGVYTIKVKTNDSEKESGWSESHEIHIAFLDIQISGGMGVTVQLRNHLNATKPGRYVDWTMDLIGGTFPGFHINKHMSGTDFLEAGGSTIITQSVFALGKFSIKVTVQATGEPVITEDTEAMVLFFYVII